jgi:hypothetical protein
LFGIINGDAVNLKVKCIAINFLMPKLLFSGEKSRYSGAKISIIKNSKKLMSVLLQT